MFFVFSVLIIRSDEVTAQSSKSAGKRKPAISKSVTQESAAGITDYSSKNFVLHTDLPPSDSNELLARLEKMLSLIVAYYGKPNLQLIEMYVVSDIAKWPVASIPDEARNSLNNEAGITLTVTAAQHDELGQKQILAAKAVVWAVATRGVPQHEAVHAYCHQNFGRTGPTWYAEGMAEMGQYWREKEEGVRIHEGVLGYLKRSEPKDLLEITASGQQTGDSWKNYAWRWALCHLLATNPNYAPRFKPLGLALLNGQKTRFEDTYGEMAKEISFEYLFFLKHVDQGFRCDLCAWDWKSRFVRIRGSTTTQVRIAANRGWQASRALLKKGDKISLTAAGEWTLKKEGPKIGADGDTSGSGRLLGVLFDDYQLSEPFDLGGYCEYEAAQDGNLFLRCNDDWCEIADNAGSITVKIKAVN
jgi:hypothetical protein